MIANTCIEATGRSAMELGYHVTLVKDATAAFSPEAMHAAHAINGPTYAHVITTTDELAAELTGERSAVAAGSVALTCQAAGCSGSCALKAPLRIVPDRVHAIEPDLALN
jgi:Isochorismatase family